MFRTCIMVLDSCIRRVLPCVLRWIAVSFNIWTQINFLLKWMLNYVHIYLNIATWTNELSWHLNGIGRHHHFPWCMISDKQFFQRLIQKIKDNKCKWIKWLNEFESNIYLDILELMAIGGLHRSMVWEWMWFNDDDDHQWECVCVCVCVWNSVTLLAHCIFHSNNPLLQTGRTAHCSGLKFTGFPAWRPNSL